METHIEGILIKNSNAESLIGLLEKTSNISLINVTQIDFSEALNRQLGSGYIDVLSTERGNLILWDVKPSPSNFEELSIGTEVLEFILSESTGSFLFTKYKNGAFICKETIGGNESISDSSNLSYSGQGAGVFDVFSNCCFEYLGVNFRDLNTDTILSRYQIEVIEKPTFDHLQVDDILENFRKTIFSKPKKIALVSKSKTGIHLSFETYLHNKGYGENEIKALCELVSKKEHWISNRDRSPSLDGQSRKFLFFGFFIIICSLASLYYVASIFVNSIFHVNILNWSVVIKSLSFILSVIVVFSIYKAFVKKDKVLVTIYNSGQNKIS